MSGVPELLTVEEAARLIRIGRTKAYAMAREWRATGGQSGLPVVAFGNVLRVPRHALEQLVGSALNEFPTEPECNTEAGSSIATAIAVDDSSPGPSPSRKRATRSTSAEQASLFEPRASSRKA